MEHMVPVDLTGPRPDADLREGGRLPRRPRSHGSLPTAVRLSSLGQLPGLHGTQKGAAPGLTKTVLARSLRLRSGVEELPVLMSGRDFT